MDHNVGVFFHQSRVDPLLNYMNNFCLQIDRRRVASLLRKKSILRGDVKKVAVFGGMFHKWGGGGG